MPFLSLEFGALLAVAVVFFHVVPVAARPGYLLALSYAFYATWSAAHLGLLFAVTAVVWAIAPRVGPRAGSRTAPLLALALVALFGMLFAFKYLPEIANPRTGLSSIAIPLGISYYTFRLTSYLIDVYWGNLAPEPHFIDFALYVSFFPQIVSGPIQRAGDFRGQLAATTPIDAEQIASGLRLVLFGTFKKLIVANRLALLITTVFDAPHRASGAAFLVAAWAYPVQLYADFSGISDIAIGIGRLFGIEAPPNFDNPFYASNVQAFWRRWHISLTSWLGDYLFIPLYMSLRRLGRVGLVVALMVNMLAIGAWHGAGWKFIVFGLINGVYLSLSALTLKHRDKAFRAWPALARVRGVVAPLITFHLIAFALVFARADSLFDALFIVRHLIPSHEPGWGLRGVGLNVFGLPGLAALVLMEAVHLSRGGGTLERAFISSPVWVRCSVYYAAAVSVLWFGQFGIQEFIYAGF